MQVAFFQGAGNIYNFGIRLVTHGPYSHCELVFSDQTWYSSDPNDGGTRFKKIIPLENQWRFLDIPTTIEQEQKIRDFCTSELGCGYDWMGVARFVIPYLKPSKNKWFCSEVCCAGLQQIGMLEYSKDYWFSPNGLERKLDQVCHFS